MEFGPGQLPKIYNAISITNEGGHKVIAEVAQHLGENTVRAISMESTDGMTRGMDALDTGDTITTPVGKEILGRVLNVVGEPVDEAGEVKGQKTVVNTPRRASTDGSIHHRRAFGDRHKSHRPFGAISQRWKDRPVWRRWCRQNRPYPGAYKKHRHGALRLFGFCRCG